ncbi:MAG: glycosyltransferase family 4 protein [Rikenellaceae bacterium]
MKIAYLIQGLHYSGGMERVISAKASYLAEMGHSVTIVTTDGLGKEPYYTIHPDVVVKCFGLEYLADFSKGKLRQYLSFKAKQRNYRTLIREFLSQAKFDIVISTFGTERYIVPTLKDGSVKIAESHFAKEYRTFRGRSGLFALLDRRRIRRDEKVASRYASFVVLTHEDAAKWNSSNVVVIPNATSFLPKEVAELSQKRAIAVGRLTFQKGFDMLIKSWSLVNKNHPDWRLDIFGSGEDKSLLESIIHQFNLTGAVTIYPPTTTIQNELLNSGVYLLSSRLEGLPMVLLEAMSCGVPAVSFQCPTGPRDVIESGIDGVLVENGNIQKFAEAVCRAIENDELRVEMGKMARRKIEEKFSVEPIMKKWIELFNSSLKR